MGTYSIFRDIINVYISMQGPDRQECPHVEYNVSVSRALIGRLSNPAHVCPIPTFTFTMQVKPSRGFWHKEEGRRECLERWTTAYSPSLPPRAHWPSVTGGVTISRSGKFLTLDDVLCQESAQFNTPLRHCRACPETLMVAEETQLSREDIYVIYIHKASSSDYNLLQPATAGAPTAPRTPRTPTTAPATDDMPEWAAWDRLFPLFNQTHGISIRRVLQ